MSQLEFLNVSFHYRSEFLGKKLGGIEAISFAIPNGECLGYLGHNGAGKSTSMKLMLGLLTPDSGTVRLQGRDPRETASRNGVGFVPEQPYIYEHTSVAEFLDWSATLSGIAGSARRQAINKIVDRLSLGALLARRIKEVSKGQLQRLLLAQALVHEPQILILDEPFSGLDPISRREVRQLFLEEKKRGATLLIATHILPDVEALCDRALIISHGRLRGVLELEGAEQKVRLVLKGSGDISSGVQAGSLSLQHIAEHSVELLYPSAQSAQQALHHAMHSGFQIEFFGKETSSLEERFLAVTEGRVVEEQM